MGFMKSNLYKNILIRNFYRYAFILYLIFKSLWTSCTLHSISFAFIFYCVGSCYVFVNFFFLIYFFFESLIKNAGDGNKFGGLNYFIFDSASDLFLIVLIFCFILIFFLFICNILNILNSIKERVDYFSFIFKRKMFLRGFFILLGVILIVFMIKNLLIPLYIWYFFYFKHDYYNSVISFYPEISFVLFFYEIKQIIFFILISCGFLFVLFYKIKNENIGKFSNLFILYKSIFYLMLFAYVLFACPPHLFYVLLLLIFFLLFDLTVINYLWVSKKKKFFFLI